MGTLSVNPAAQRCLAERRTPRTVGWSPLPMAYMRATVEKPDDSPEVGNKAKVTHEPTLAF